jgi:CBS domain-containing protein
MFNEKESTDLQEFFSNKQRGTIMTVEELLTYRASNVVYSIHPDKSIFDAMQLMHKHRIGALMVLDDPQHIAGIISERDIFHMYATAEHQAHEVMVKDFMTPKEQLIVGAENDDLEYIMGVMGENRIRHMPIIGKKGQLLAIVSIGDVVRSLLKNMTHEKKMLEDYMKLDEKGFFW